MTAREIETIQESMEIILPDAMVVGTKMYERLFEIASEVRPLFKEDIEKQSRKLMSILVHITANLDQFDMLKEELEQLAIKHEAYQVEAAHYDILRAALFWTLEQHLQAAWTPEMATAWGKAYQAIASSMIATQVKAAK
ncbi:MAG: globin domain-containing protein [Bacteroidota bacterium]